MEYVSAQVEPDWHIPAICCTFHEKHDCVKRQIGKICDEDNVNYVTEIIDSYVKDVTAFACGPFKSTLECDRRFNASVWSPLKRMVMTSNETVLAMRHKYRSSLTPAL